MPCYIGDEDDNKVIIKKVDNPNLISRVNTLEAGLCAIINELEKRGIANEVISQASRSGLIDIMSFWEEHRKEDEVRLAKELHKFSEHEQDVLRRLLKDDNRRS